MTLRDCKCKTKTIGGESYLECKCSDSSEARGLASDLREEDYELAKGDWIMMGKGGMAGTALLLRKTSPIKISEIKKRVEERLALKDESAIELAKSMEPAYEKASKLYSSTIKALEEGERLPVKPTIRDEMGDIFSPECGGLGFVNIKGIKKGSDNYNAFRQFCEDEKKCRLSEYGNEVSASLVFPERSTYTQCIAPKEKAYSTFLKSLRGNFPSKELFVSSRLD